MMCLDAEDLKSRAGWDGAAGVSRQHLLSELSSKSALNDSHEKRNLASNADCVYRVHFTFCNDTRAPARLSFAPSQANTDLEVPLSQYGEFAVIIL